MGQALFIVWRESIEALLVVGILYAWLQRQPDNRLLRPRRKRHMRERRRKQDAEAAK